MKELANKSFDIEQVQVPSHYSHANATETYNMYQHKRHKSMNQKSKNSSGTQVNTTELIGYKTHTQNMLQPNTNFILNPNISVHNRSGNHLSSSAKDASIIF